MNLTLRQLPDWRNNLIKASRRLRKPLGFFVRKEKVMYQNVNTGEVWKLNSVETIRTWKNEVKVYLKIYVFENGERWAEDLFIKHWRKVGEAQQSVERMGESLA